MKLTRIVVKNYRFLFARANASDCELGLTERMNALAGPFAMYSATRRSIRCCLSSVTGPQADVGAGQQRPAIRRPSRAGGPRGVLG